ncbi:MAG: class I SAM-dependent methyltransferase, partial [Cruoricaptor ignavus]|nr:class I SAM-dependent methyltransferase [Cruoricaptor ignavus]
MAWFKEWFNTPYYHILYKNRSFVEAQNFISLLVENLALPKNSKIIDLACGKGRHSVYLNQLGFNVLGLDLSEENIAHNKIQENETLRFAVHDMRKPILGESANAVFNLFTSFGYFDEVEEDKMVFSSVHSVLQKGGFFVLD